MGHLLGFSAPVSSSSFIKQITYYSENNILVVTIQAGNQRCIPYEYHDVPLQTVSGFLKSKSKGKYFNKFIKKKYSECLSFLLKDS